MDRENPQHPIYKKYRKFISKLFCIVINTEQLAIGDLIELHVKIAPKTFATVYLIL